jgi:hypothetical protein
MLASIYPVMLVGQPQLLHALLGALAAVMLWEPSRHVLVWYFAKLSLIGTSTARAPGPLERLVRFPIGPERLSNGQPLLRTFVGPFLRRFGPQTPQSMTAVTSRSEHPHHRRHH